MGRKSVEERFWAKVHQGAASDCWPWTGSASPKGYGLFYLNGSTERAHRVAFYLAHGRWPEPECLHSCDNPPCCNPSCLREGTQAENMADRDERGRGRWRRGEDHRDAKLTADSVRAIRVEYAEGDVTMKELGDRYGVSKQQVHNIVHRKKWKEI